MRFSRHVMLSVTVGAALTGASARIAWAECHTVFFTSLEVEDCDEFGTCDWRVECAINDQQNVTLVSSEEADSNESVAIDEALVTNQEFPITVHCTVLEHDGGIGAGWEDVLDKSKIITGPGNYTLEDSSNEGTVDLHFTVDTPDGGTGTTCDALSTKTYDGVFRAGTGSQVVEYDLVWSTFVQKWNQHSAAGLRLLDLETRLEDGVRRYTGTFRAGTGGYYLWGGVNWASFSTKWTELSNAGYRLIDIESYIEGGVRVYASVYRAGTDGHYLWAGQSYASMVAKINELYPLGLRLIDLETYMEGGVRVYTGVFRAGTGGQYVVNGMTWSAFVDQWEELADAGYRLIDMENYQVSGAQVFAGVFRPGTDGHYLWRGVDQANMKAKIAELAALGLRLVDLDVH